MNTYTLPDGTLIDLCDDCEEEYEVNGVELTNRTPAPGHVCESCRHIDYT